MEKKSSIISASILALGIVIMGFCLKAGIDNFVNKGRNVEVKGLAEREVEANKVTWPITLKETGNEIQTLYSTINAKTATVKKFLTDNGIKSDEISVNPPIVNDYKTAGAYQQDVKYRYTITSSLTVVSKDVKKVRDLISRQGELVAQDIAIDYGSDWDNRSKITYEYTDFKKMKPEMVAEAIENAQKTAEQFAKNSNSKLDKIVAADQGSFEIVDRDESTPYIKNIRVVSHITFSLKN